MKIELAKEQTGDVASKPRGNRGRFVAYAAVFVLGMGAMWVVQTTFPGPAAAIAAKEFPQGAGQSRTASRTGLKAGEFEYISIPLEEPVDHLPDVSQPLPPTRWFFPNFTPEKLEGLFAGCGLTPEPRAALLDRARWVVSDQGIAVMPSAETVLNLGRSARETIYSTLAQTPENSAQCDPFRFRPEKFRDWCARTGLGREQLALLRKLTYARGGSLCFCDGPVMQQLLGPGDFKCLVRALYGEQTFLMRLVIRPDSNIDSIIRYWGCERLRPLLESMSKVPGGSSINVSYLLPVFARMRLYTFAASNGDAGCLKENCFWTAMNFFREAPDPRFVSAHYTQQTLESAYSRITGRPRYGDLIMLTDAHGQPLHLSVYLADDVVFTKNGGDHLQPWVLMRIPDMCAYYNANEPAQMVMYRPRQ